MSVSQLKSLLVGLLVCGVLILGGYELGTVLTPILNQSPPPSSVPSPSLTPTVTPLPDFELTASPSAGVKKDLNLETAVVSRVIDGDTIMLSDGRRLRYIGIDTAETVHPTKEVGCFGKDSSAFNKALVEGKTVELEKDIGETDRYQRLLRYVWLDQVLVNDYLVREGYAYVSTYPPDVKYQRLFQAAQTEAQSQSKGLWAACPLDEKL